MPGGLRHLPRHGRRWRASRQPHGPPRRAIPGAPGQMNETRLLLQRVRKADVIDEPCVVPEGFNLDDYIEGPALAYPLSGRSIRFKAWFNPDAAVHVRETPLSDDQKLKQAKDGTIIEASLRETIELKWWLLGLGERVKVLGPKSLRDEMKKTAEAMANQYR